ncbi:magnesium transporter NIPA4 isoform X2 [Cynoglossus semilaevis]|uniref:NIPA like domain containing 4 n=1 Tax=Cynoglossus semilaevis TaxID=244447 RepID=A0A3P8V9G0_CYNSE|nr:magnesium transporter NIPA2-like isoform X2 [Cynoglossus semilaevis]
MRDVHPTNNTCDVGSLVKLWCRSGSAVLCLITGNGTEVDAHLNDSSHMTVVNASYNHWSGLTLAVLSAFLIGSSVILKKKALLRLASAGQTRAGDGGHGYLKDWLWWGGLLTMGAGEVCNFVAYMFAPATLVTPLGALSVIISALLSSYLLGEVLNVVGKLGCLLCVLGSILLVIHAPEEQEVTSLQEMTHKMLEPGFLVYVSVVLLLCVALIFYFSPRFGGSNILVYISVCSLLGAFTVSSVKGLAIVINTVLYDISVLAHPLSWIFLVTLLVSIVTQVNYLNKSLDTFNTLLVYPIYYVLFTSVVLSTSIILFQEWRSMAAVDVVTIVGAFSVIVVGVAMLHLFKELQVTMKQLTSQLTSQLTKPPEGEGPTEETANVGRQQGVNKERRYKKEDKYELMDNMVIESLPPMREDGPRVFIIS